MEGTGNMEQGRGSSITFHLLGFGHITLRNVCRIQGWPVADAFHPLRLPAVQQTHLRSITPKRKH